MNLKFKVVKESIRAQNWLEFDELFYGYLMEKVCGVLWF